MDIKSVKYGGFAIGAIALAVVGFVIWGSEATQAQMPGGPQGPMPVEMLDVKAEDVRVWKEFPGRLEAVDAADIRPQVSGRIMQVNFEDGQTVAEGDLLFVIDPRPYEASLAQAKAALLAGRSQYNLAQKNLERAEDLVKTKAISKRILDERKSARSLALAEIKAAEAAIQQAEINIDYANVKAPISGRTSRVEITQGNLVQAGPNAPVLTTIVADKDIYVDFEVDEQTYLSHIRQNAKNQAQEKEIPVEVILRGHDQVPVKGVIYAFDNQINPSSGTIRARAIIKNEEGGLLPGMFAKVRLGGASLAKNVLIPEKAISTDQDRKFVYTVGKEGVAEYREVKLGERVLDRRVVLSGLQEGDKIISGGIIKIRPGVPVKPLEMGGSDMPPPESGAQPDNKQMSEEQ